MKKVGISQTYSTKDEAVETYRNVLNEVKGKNLDRLENFILSIETESRTLKGNVETVVESLKIDSNRKKVFITGSLLGLVNLISRIPLSKLNAMEKFVNQNGFLKTTSMMTGGMLGDISLFTLGIAPYVSSNLIIDLLGKIIPTLDGNFEGEYGKKKKERVVKGLTFFIGLLNGLAISYGIVDAGILVALGMAIGSVLLGSIASFITNHGIGKGTDMLVANGVLQNLNLGGLSWVGLATIPSIAKMLSKFNQARVNVPTINRKHKEGKIPFKILNNGIMPMVMSSSVLAIISLFMPSLVSQYEGVMLIVQSVLLYAFNCLMSSLFLDIGETSKITKQKSIMIKGKRPGKETESYLAKIRANASLVGSIGLIAILILPAILGTKIVSISGLLLVVSCLTRVIEQLESSVKESCNVGFLKKIS